MLIDVHIITIPYWNQIKPYYPMNGWFNGVQLQGLDMSAELVERLRRLEVWHMVSQFLKRVLMQTLGFPRSFGGFLKWGFPKKSKNTLFISWKILLKWMIQRYHFRTPLFGHSKMMVKMLAKHWQKPPPNRHRPLANFECGWYFWNHYKVRPPR